MQEQDAVSIDYFQDNERFADLINGYVYQGEELVKPGDIREINRTDARICRKDGRPYAQVTFRDVVRQVKRNLQVAVVALENQTDIHYAMPVRVMNGDGMCYDAQVRRIRNLHREKKDLRGAEYLSGFSRRDRLIPAFTIVVYFGRKEWDGPRCLKDMMELGNCPKEMRDMIADYPIHLLEVRKYPDLDHFHTDIRDVFGFLQNAEDAQGLESYVREHKERFSELREDAYDLICVMAHSKELKQMKSDYRTEGGYNMCQAIADMIENSVQRGRTEGRKEGIKEGIKEGEENGILLTKAVLRMDASGLSVREISEKCRISVDRVNYILES